MRRSKRDEDQASCVLLLPVEIAWRYRSDTDKVSYGDMNPALMACLSDAQLEAKIEEAMADPVEPPFAIRTTLKPAMTTHWSCYCIPHEAMT